MRPAEGQAATAGRPAWSVAGLVQAVAETLAARFASVTVRGEISGFTRAASGHCYFTLKDPDGGASLRCAMFRRAAALLASLPGEGEAVELRGRVAVYEPRGELQFVAESLQRAGAGALYERFLRLKAQLAAEGLFDAGRKRPLPALPRCVGVVSSLAGAALHDVCTALARRAPQVRVLVLPSPVQGVEAPAALCAALAAAARRPEIELLILARGGGSMEDLWAFNDPALVRAIAAHPVPVITGIGHETDLSLADLAADLRAPTPTAAAELAAPSRDSLLLQLAQLARRADEGVNRRLEREGERLDRLGLRLARPAQRLAREQERLGGLDQRRRRALERALQARGQTLERLALRGRHAAQARREGLAQQLAGLGVRLDALDPARVLARGWSRLQAPDGRLLSSITQLQPGEPFEAVLADGRVQARAEALRPPQAPGRRRTR